MNSRIITYAAVIVAIVAVLSSAFIYTSMQTQLNDTKIKSTMTLVDDEGYVTNLTSVPQRVVSLAPSNTQIMFAIGEGSKVVGVTDYDNYPYNFSAWIAAGNMTSIGGFSTPNMEAIASVHPDLILATPINDPDVVTMRNLGYKVIVINPNDVPGDLRDIALVGRAMGADNAASTLVTNLNAQINSITSKIAAANFTSKPLVYYEIWWNPEMSAGGTSWVNDIISKAGGVNIFVNDTDQWPTISPESVVQMNPDVILLPTGMGSGTFYGSLSDVASRPGWSSINAVKNNRIIVIDGDLFAESGPRVADQIAAISQALYPSLFSSTS